MVPGIEITTTPLRPYVTWDFKNVPWTYGQGFQTLYSHLFLHWSTFHDDLNYINSNQIAQEHGGIVLFSHIFGDASNLFSIQAEVVATDDNTAPIVDAIYKKDALSVVSDVFTKLQSLFKTFRRSG